MLSTVDAIGYAAAILTTAAFAPQVLRTWRTRSAGDLSMTMLVTQGLGNAMWFAFALGTATLPLALANGFTFAMVAALAVMKLAEQRRLARFGPAE